MFVERERKRKRGGRILKGRPYFKMKKKAIEDIITDLDVTIFKNE